MASAHAPAAIGIVLTWHDTGSNHTAVQITIRAPSFGNSSLTNFHIQTPEMEHGVRFSLDGS